MIGLNSIIKASKKKSSKNYFMKNVKIKKGALSKQLMIPEKKNIPKGLLRKIIGARPGMVVKNPYKVGKKKIKVTRLMERRSILALNLKSFKR